MRQTEASAAKSDIARFPGGPGEAGTRPCSIQSDHFRDGMPEYSTASEMVTVQSNI